MQLTAGLGTSKSQLTISPHLVTGYQRYIGLQEVATGLELVKLPLQVLTKTHEAVHHPLASFLHWCACSMVLLRALETLTEGMPPNRKKVVAVAQERSKSKAEEAQTCVGRSST